MRTTTLAVLGTLLLTMGCGGTEPDGTADIFGQVSNTSGQPVRNTTVAISCPRIALATTATTATTDTLGHYSVALQAPSARRTFLCSFGVPDLVAPLVRVDTLIGFADGLHAQQFIDLTTP